jgi:dTDP-4-amino-4,6-dideoxygalactose transaminase
VSVAKAHVRFQRPSLPAQELIDHYFERSREAGWYSNFGPCVREFESRISHELLSDLAVVSASNATVGLMVAVRAVFGEPSPGKNLVLVPSFTFIGSLSAIVWAGFRPYFLDVEEGDLQISRESITEAVTNLGDRVAGAMLTTTFGTPWPESRLAPVEALLADRGVPVVLDSAAGLGSCSPSVTPGSASVYSLHATKPFAIGEGALIACPDRSVADRIRELTNFGFGDGHGLESTIGFNAKLPEVLGATGLAVLDNYPETLAARRSSALDLIARVASSGMSAQTGHPASTFQFVPVLCSSATHRERLLVEAVEADVQLRTYFDPPMHLVPAFRGDETCPSLASTERAAARIVALPMANVLPQSDADAIVELCRSVWS